MTSVRERLTTTSHTLLAQVAIRPWSAYELAEQRVRYFRYVWPRAESAIYREVKRLSQLGLLAAEKEYTGKRPRTVYTITEAGRAALREWLTTPVSPFSMEFEAIMRIFVAPIGTKDDLLGTLKQVHQDTLEMLRFAGEVKQEFLDGINAAQHDVHLRALGVDFFTSFLVMVEAWAERTIAEVESWEHLDTDEDKRARALARIRDLPVRTPSDHLREISKAPASQLRGRR